MPARHVAAVLALVADGADVETRAAGEDMIEAGDDESSAYTFHPTGADEGSGLSSSVFGDFDVIG
jgi:hypothetical protein